MSKLILFDFECSACNTVFDDLVKSTVHSIECPTCKGEAKRLVSKGHLDYRMGVSTAFPTMADKWARMQEQKARTDKGSLADGAPNLKMY
jgi:putative FmdB family regulatory protein